MRSGSVAAPAAFILLAGAVHAQDAWRFQVTPYVWGPSLQGHVSPAARLPRVSFDKSLGSIFDDLNAAFFLNGSARRGRFVLLADLTYSDLSEKHAWTLDVPVVPREIRVSAEVGLKMTAATFAAGYSVVDRADFVLDLLAGARIWHADANLDIPNRIPRLPDSFSQSGSWAEPIVAVRARYQFAPAWSAIGYADYGAGVESDTTWQAVGTVNYAFNDHWFASAGYRALALEFDDGGFEFDSTLGGPLLGVTYRF